MSPTRVSLPILLILILPRVSGAFFWGYYPACAQPQLQANAPESCDTGDVAGVACLCTSSKFLAGSAVAIWQNCGCDVLATSANVANSICVNADLTIALTPAQMISAGDGGLSICSNPSNISSSSPQPSTFTASASNTVSTVGGGSTLSPTSTPTATTEPPASSGLSTGAKAGIGVSVGVLSAIVLVLAFFLIRRRLANKRLRSVPDQTEMNGYGGKAELATGPGLIPHNLMSESLSEEAPGQHAFELREQSLNPAELNAAQEMAELDAR